MDELIKDVIKKFPELDRRGIQIYCDPRLLEETHSKRIIEYLIEHKKVTKIFRKKKLLIDPSYKATHVYGIDERKEDRRNNGSTTSSKTN